MKTLDKFLGVTAIAAMPVLAYQGTVAASTRAEMHTRLEKAGAVIQGSQCDSMLDNSKLPNAEFSPWAATECRIDYSIPSADLKGCTVEIKCQNTDTSNCSVRDHSSGPMTTVEKCQKLVNPQTQKPGSISL